MRFQIKVTGGRQLYTFNRKAELSTQKDMDKNVLTALFIIASNRKLPTFI